MTDANTVYPIVTGQKLNGTIVNPHIAGEAIIYDCNFFYNVCLFMFKKETYYLSKNKNSQTNYTIYSASAQAGDKVNFKDPVGTAKLTEDLPTHLELRFKLLARSLFMSLYPRENQGNQL